MSEFYFVCLCLYKHPVLGRVTLPTPLMRCGACLECLNKYIFFYTFQQHVEQLPLRPTRAKAASCYDAYLWDNMPLVEQGLVAVEEDGRSDLDKSDQPCLLESALTWVFYSYKISTNSEGRQCSVLQ